MEKWKINKWNKMVYAYHVNLTGNQLLRSLHKKCNVIILYNALPLRLMSHWLIPLMSVILFLQSTGESGITAEASKPHVI